jgi:hypothetical protein
MKARSNVADSALTQLGNEQDPPNTANPRVATFFARYPDPLGIKDGAYFCVALASMPVRGFGPKVALHIEDGKESIWLDPALMESLIVSIRFHRGRLARNLLMQHDEELMAVFGRVTGSSFPEFRRVPSSEEGTRTESADDESLTSYTIVEMTTQVVKPTETSWQACEPAPGVMGPTLTRCITALIQVVNAYRFAEKISIPAPARERIGPTITAATRHADPANGGWDSPADYVMNLFASWHQAVLHGTEQPDTMKRMGTYLRLESMDHPSIPSMQVQADLDSAFFHEGNFRATAIFAHSASEVLLDIALMGILFEEGKLARDAVSHFFNRPLKTRLLTDFHERIGGGLGHPAAIMRSTIGCRECSCFAIEWPMRATCLLMKKHKWHAMLTTL